MPYIGTCFRFYTQMQVEKKKRLPIKFIVTSHNSVRGKPKTFQNSNEVKNGCTNSSIRIVKKGPQCSAILLFFLFKCTRSAPTTLSFALELSNKVSFLS